MTDMHKDMQEMSGLLVKAMARISELEMRVELMSEEVKGKSKVVDLTGDDEQENVDVLGSPFCLEPARCPVREAQMGMLWSAAGLLEVGEEYEEMLQRAVDLSGWPESLEGPGSPEAVGEKNPESPEA